MIKLIHPRLTPARPDLAASYLRGKVEAARFVEGTARQVIDAQAPVRSSPRPDAPLLTEALKGERATIYETTEEGWAWGQLEADGYVGWLPANALAAPGPAPTHKVAVPRAAVFPGPSIKLAPVEALPLGAQVTISRVEGPFAVMASGGYVPMRHLAAIHASAHDPIAVAEMFMHVPYIWGGKTSAGIDCSGLVQVAFTACAIFCPRDSDMQEQALGCELPAGPALSDLRRGDIVFWEGHVALARDSETLIHANAFHMAVAIEPIAEAIERIRAAGSEVTRVRRVAASP
ncbi:MAG TPA: NlpC/P60 family protein [Xanthobacteraceae bacterium]